MKIKKILKALNIDSEVKNHIVTGIYNNSKECTKNSIFIAIGGEDFNGNKYIEEAIRFGAKTIFSSEKVNCSVNSIIVDNIRKTQAEIANVFYKNTFKKIKFIGVTGTNGKTSATTLLHNFLKKQGSLLIGTNGAFLNDEHYSLNNTTPSILTTAKLVAKAVLRNYEFVVMEVSSIGISEYRVYGIDFEYVVMMNISHDHLDYHETFDDYKNTKRKLIFQTKRHNLINKDDEILYNFKDNKTIYFSLDELDIQSTDPIIFDYLGVRYYSRLTGLINAYNILVTLKLVVLLGYDVDSFRSYLKNFKQIDGRMNILEAKGKKILIDYAHTPDAVRNVLNTLKGCVVIGCGGDRDKLKRKLIADICVKNASFSIFTSDNPRTEDQKKIFADMTNDLVGEYKVIYNRYEAIEYSLINYDVVLILGKGNERYQIIGTSKIIFNDLDAVKKILKERF